LGPIYKWVPNLLQPGVMYSLKGGWPWSLTEKESVPTLQVSHSLLQRPCPWEASLHHCPTVQFISPQKIGTCCPGIPLFRSSFLEATGSQNDSSGTWLLQFSQPGSYSVKATFLSHKVCISY
jgi:hypothetical protein